MLSALANWLYVLTAMSGFIARILASMGCVISDSDMLAREAFRDPDVLATLVTWWSDDILAADGGVNRAAIA